MMRLPFFACLLFLSSFCFRANGQAFQKIYTNSKASLFYLQDLHVDGLRQSYAVGLEQDSLLNLVALKTAPDGQLIWARQFKPVEPLHFYRNGSSITGLTDGGAVIAGDKETEHNLLGGLVLRTDPTGMPAWSKFNSHTRGLGMVATAAGRISFADVSRVEKKIYVTQLNEAGQVLWERLVQTGHMDLYNIQSLICDAQGNTVIALRVAKFLPNNAGLAPPNSILVKLDQTGTVTQVTYFLGIQIGALVPLSNGNFVFRCSPSDVSWTGIGMLDASFHCLWSKTIGLTGSIVIPNDVFHFLSVPADESRLYAIANTAGGEKLSICVDTAGNLLETHVFFSKIAGEIAATANGKGFTRGSYIRKNAFAITRSDSAGETPNCTFYIPCGLTLSNNFLQADTIGWSVTSCSYLETESSIPADYPIDVQDYCFDPGADGARFSMSDTVICVGSGIDVKRLSGVSDIPFGTSHWTFPGAVPSKAADFEVKNIRYDLPGTFQITHYFTVAGCTDSAFRLIHVAPIPTVNLGSDTTLCQGDTLRLVAGTDPLLHYSWSTGDSSRILVAGESKNYTVEVSNQAGCSGAGSIHVGFLTPGSVDLGPDTIFCEGTRIRIQPISALPGGHYKWNTGTTDTWLDVLSAGVYSLTVQTAACIQHDTIELKTTDCPDCRIYVPNIFYPEGDYPNDKFGVFPDCVLETLRFRVFDRWGNLVFESETPGASWDGKYHGKILPAGVYVYAIETQTASQNGVFKPRTLFGTITLMR